MIDVEKPLLDYGYRLCAPVQQNEFICQFNLVSYPLTYSWKYPKLLERYVD